MKERVIDYCEVECCPACGGDYKVISAIKDTVYYFGDFLIPYPEEDGQVIPVLKCLSCEIVFKKWVPTRKSLEHVFVEMASKVWKSKYKSDSYFDEKKILQRYFGNRKLPDVIDIGSSHGEFLRQISKIAGRKSGLDVVLNDRCREYVTGEYIKAYSEDDFDWSGRPYDIVTAFDLLEHLYSPALAFKNISKLLKFGGIFIAQTGNVKYADINLGEWWYIRHFEHHMVWSEISLQTIADTHGFTLESIVKTQNKDRRHLSPPKKMLLRFLNRNRNNPVLKRVVLANFGRDISTLADPDAFDHLTVVFRKG